MKKNGLIVMLFVLISGIGCYGQNKSNKKMLLVKNIPIGKYLQKNKLTSNICPKYIVVDVSNMNPTQLRDWEDDNSVYYPQTLPASTGLCSNTKRYIDIDTFIRIEQDYNKTKLAYWLKINSPDICYDEMFSIIECSHMIVDQNTIDVLEQPSSSFINYDTMKLKDVKSNLGANYDSENYKSYIKLSFVSDKIKIDLPKSYNPNDNYYSIPLIRSIIQNVNYRLNDDTVFEFRAFYITSTKPVLVIAMSFKDNTGKYHHYDFSQNPLVTSTILTNTFSPL